MLLLPPYLLNINIVNNISEILIGLLFIIVFILSIAKKRFNFFIIISLILGTWSVLSSYFLAEGIFDIFNNIRIVTLILLTNLSIKRFPNSTLTSLSIIFTLLIIVNYVTFITFQDGLYLDKPRSNQIRKAWILGIENQFALTVIPGITLALLRSWYVLKKISLISWITTIIGSLTVLLSSSATAIVSLIFFLGFILVNLGRKNNFSFFSFYLLSTVYTVLWFIVVRFNSIDNAREIIENLFEKDITLSGRTLIWNEVFDAIPNSFWYGFGNDSHVVVTVFSREFRTHNILLQSLLDNGIIGFSLLILCIVLAGLKLQKFKQNKLSFFLLIGVFALLIGGIAESYRLNNLFILLIISYNIKFLIHRTNHFT